LEVIGKACNIEIPQNPILADQINVPNASEQTELRTVQYFTYYKKKKKKSKALPAFSTVRGIPGR
jgi:hypothetical protein